MSKNILITGGTGLIGSRLTQLLIEREYTVFYLSRHRRQLPHVGVYQWDLEKKSIDAGAIEQADYIIHLAGTGIADERWSERRKREIMDSRTQTTDLLFDCLQKTPHQVRALVASSAIGFYGADSGDRRMTEDAAPGTDFVAQVCIAWEVAVQRIHELGIRTVSLRTGIVLSEKGGALARLVQPMKFGAGTVLGSGKQYMSWIHLDDVCRLYIHAIENESMQGAYNAVAPHPVTNEELTRQAAAVLHRPLILPHAPAFALRLAFGEMASVVLGGNNVSNEKIAANGFSYKFPALKPALEDLLD